MTTQLQIGQMALAEIGTRSTVTTFAENSEEAFYLNLYYTNVRDQALAAAYWNFAKVTDKLTLFKALPGTPENTSAPSTNGWQRTYPQPPWIYSYFPPTDMIAARALVAQPNISLISPPLYPIMGGTIAQPRTLRAPFEIQIDPYDTSGNPFGPPKIPPSPPQKVILTNAQTPLLEYTTSLVDESVWAPDFVMVMVKALAAYLAVALTSDKQLAQLKINDANNIIMEARRIDANEGTTILDHTPDWMRIRGVGGVAYTGEFWYPYGPMFSMSGYL